MARRWTPRRFVRLRRIRVAICAVAVALASTVAFGVAARKTIALSINGDTQTVTTYAMNVTRLLEERGVDVKSHDLVQSTSGDILSNHDVVTVRSAYQTTISIDGQRVPFWTVATSASQLLGFFQQNENEAAKVTVDIDNIYSQLTGGLVINESGPVTVIADGKTSVAPNGKLPAASILDSKGISLNKEDRVSVEKDGDKTVLRVQRVTHGQETTTVAIPHGSQTIVDKSLKPGTSVVRQQGEDGEKKQVYNVTYVDGIAETRTLISETTAKISLDTIVAVGRRRPPNLPTPARGKPIKAATTPASRATSRIPASRMATPRTAARPAQTSRMIRRTMTKTTTRTTGIRATTATQATQGTQAIAATPETRETRETRETPATTAATATPAIPAAARRDAYGTRPPRRPKPTHPARPHSAAGPATTGHASTSCGPANPDGCGTPRTRRPAPTESRSRCLRAKWPSSAQITVTTALCRSTGGWRISPNGMAARPRHGNAPSKSAGTDSERYD